MPTDSNVTNSSDDEFKAHLSEEEYAVLRDGATEPPFSGEYVDLKEDGMYHCKACGAPLFSSETKFDSGSGWPSFTKAAEEGSVTLVPDKSLGMTRTEVRCARCDSHLGHVFDDLPAFRGQAGGPQEEGGKRYCINSVALDFKET